MNPITLIWIILGILVLVTVVAAVTAGVSRRKALREGSKPAQVSPAPTESGKTVPEAETPAGGESAVGRPESEASQVAEPAVEAPEAPGSRMARLRRRLANSNNALARGLAELLSADKLDDDAWDDFETTLITSDLGVGPTTELVEKLRSELAIDGISDPAHAREVLHHELVELVGSDMDRSINLDRLEGKPAVVLMVGVNGTGKTTTCGKLARVLVAEGKTVLLGAADTFRAAAVDQLTRGRAGFDYYPRTPLREEVLHEVRGADGALIGAVTRNRMGVEVLNTDVLLVADVDLPPQRKLFRTVQPDPRPALERIARWAAAHRPRCAHLSHRSRPARHHHRAGERASRPDGPRRPRLGRPLRAVVRTARDLAGPADAEAPPGRHAEDPCELALPR